MPVRCVDGPLPHVGNGVGVKGTVRGINWGGYNGGRIDLDARTSERALRGTLAHELAHTVYNRLAPAVRERFDRTAGALPGTYWRSGTELFAYTSQKCAGYLVDRLAVTVSCSLVEDARRGVAG